VLAPCRSCSQGIPVRLQLLQLYWPGAWHCMHAQQSTATA
jgi:hypothetical protein